MKSPLLDDVSEFMMNATNLMLHGINTKSDNLFEYSTEDLRYSIKQISNSIKDLDTMKSLTGYAMVYGIRECLVSLSVGAKDELESRGVPYEEEEDTIAVRLF